MSISLSWPYCKRRMHVSRLAWEWKECSSAHARGLGEMSVLRVALLSEFTVLTFILFLDKVCSTTNDTKIDSQWVKCIISRIYQIY